MPRSCVSFKKKGYSLIEMAIVISLMAIVSAGVAALLLAGSESQISHQVASQQETAALLIVDDIRQQMAKAKKVAVPNSATLRIYQSNPKGGNDITVEYIFSGTQLIRTPKIFSTSPYDFSQCRDQNGNTVRPNFIADPPNNASDGSGTPIGRVVLTNLCIRDTKSRSAMDQKLGNTEFRLSNLTFEVPGGRANFN